MNISCIVISIRIGINISYLMFFPTCQLYYFEDIKNWILFKINSRYIYITIYCHSMLSQCVRLSRLCLYSCTCIHTYIIKRLQACAYIQVHIKRLYYTKLQNVLLVINSFHFQACRYMQHRWIIIIKKPSFIYLHENKSFRIDIGIYYICMYVRKCT